MQGHGHEVKQIRTVRSGFAKGFLRHAFALTAMVLAQAAMTWPATAQDEEEPRWFGETYENTALLAYGVPDSDYIMLSFYCTAGEPTLHVYVQDEESSLEEGALMLVRLSAGGEKIEFSDKAILNQDSGGADIDGRLPLNDALRRILTATGELEILVDGHSQRYDMQGAAEPVAALIAACDTPDPANNLDVTLTNKAQRPLQSFVYSVAGTNNFEGGDAFDPEPLGSGASWTFSIPNGRSLCTFDIAVNFEEDECCSDPLPAGTQDLCENAEFIVHD